MCHALSLLPCKCLFCLNTKIQWKPKYICVANDSMSEHFILKLDDTNNCLSNTIVSSSSSNRRKCLQFNMFSTKRTFLINVRQNVSNKRIKWSV